MKQYLAAFILFGGIVAVAGPLAGDPGQGFVDLFNGKDLSGWVNVNTDPDTWILDDPQIYQSSLT